MVEPGEAIIRLLDDARVAYKTSEHAPVHTSEEAAAVRGASMSEAAKSLLFRTKEGAFVLVVLPGDKRADSKKLKALLGTKELSFAKPEEVEGQMGCQIGACYPFGVIANLRTLVDESLGENEQIYFNPGRHDVTIKMSYADYLALAKPEVVAIAS